MVRPRPSPRSCERDYAEGISVGEAVRLGARVLAPEGQDPVAAEALEVAFLERAAPDRAFRRLKGDELAALSA